MSMPVKLVGVGASPGAAVGRAFPIDRRRLPEPRRHLRPEEVEAELARLQDAVQKSDRQLEAVRARLGPDQHQHALIIEAHRMMLADPVLLGEAIELVRQERINAEWAVRRVVRQVSEQFDAVEDLYLRERQSDVLFVGERVVRNLMGLGADLNEAPPDDSIVVAQDLSPADVALLFGGGRRVAGILCDAGGKVSHTAIVARALEVPAVLGVGRGAELVGSDDLVALDGGSGLVVIRPTEVDVRSFLDLQRRYREREREALATRGLEAATRDGHRVVLRANIELVEEIPSLVAHGADGIGLYRTEFLFLNRRTVPTEEEHYDVYKRLLEAMPGHQVTVRTFDLGGDKALPGRERQEENPTLGLRAVRYCLAHPELFMPQLRALWRASVHGNLRVMFPLISGRGELRRVRRLFYEARDQVLADGHEVADDLPAGIMVETPAAAVTAEDLAEDAAFFSIGTNDLIQYSLAIDRRNRDVDYLYSPLHPAILRFIRLIVEAGRAKGIPVSVCGEMAGDPACTLVLVALGVGELSMSGTAIPMVKQLIRSSSRAEAKELLERALDFPTAEETEKYVRGEMARRFPDICGLLPESASTTSART